MNSVILSNSYCIVIILALVAGMFLRKEKRDIAARNFTIVLFAQIAYLSLNILGEVFEKYTDLATISFIVNMLSFFSIDLLEISFIHYLYSLLPNTGLKTRKSLNIVIMLCFADMITIAALSLTGELFTIENGVYTEGKYIAVPYYFTAVILTAFIAIVIANRKNFSTRRLVVVLVYLLIPIPATIVELYTGVYTITPLCITISILLIYIFIQAVTIEDGRIREAVLEELSSTDLLTKLQNRRAYYNRVRELDNNNLGVMFCDINGLKYTNDHFGHAAGDELIIKFAGIMTEKFGISDVYRISGDEFIVLVPDCNEDEFVEKLVDFKKIIEDNKKIASVGFSFGSGSCIEKLVSDAENSMYHEKEKNHVSR